MTDLKIKFSHNYPKLPANPTAELIQVFVVDFEDLSKEFIEYDTQFVDKDSFGNYPLPRGKLLVLLFRDFWNLFTTVRRWTPEKQKYYQSNTGNLFNVVIECQMEWKNRHKKGT